MASMGVCFDGHLDLFPSYGKLAGMDQGGIPLVLGRVPGVGQSPIEYRPREVKKGCHAYMRARMLATHRRERMGKGGT